MVQEIDIQLIRSIDIFPFFLLIEVHIGLKLGEVLKVEYICVPLGRRVERNIAGWSSW